MSYVDIVESVSMSWAARGLERTEKDLGEAAGSRRQTIQCWQTLWSVPVTLLYLMLFVLFVLFKIFCLHSLLVFSSMIQKEGHTIFRKSSIFTVFPACVSLCFWKFCYQGNVVPVVEILCRLCDLQSSTPNPPEIFLV